MISDWVILKCDHCSEEFAIRKHTIPPDGCPFCGEELNRKIVGHGTMDEKDGDHHAGASKHVQGHSTRV